MVVAYRVPGDIIIARTIEFDTITVVVVVGGITGHDIIVRVLEVNAIIIGSSSITIVIAGDVSCHTIITRAMEYYTIISVIGSRVPRYDVIIRHYVYAISDLRCRGESL